jgi:hypothetical protein
MDVTVKTSVLLEVTPHSVIYTNVLKNLLHLFSGYMSKLSLEEEDV